MKLSELMATHTPSPTFEGFVTNDDFVLAIDCSAEGSAEVKDYAPRRQPQPDHAGQDLYPRWPVHHEDWQPESL